VQATQSACAHSSRRRLKDAHAARVQRGVDVAHQVQLDAIRRKGERREVDTCACQTHTPRRQHVLRASVRMRTASRAFYAAGDGGRVHGAAQTRAGSGVRAHAAARPARGGGGCAHVARRAGSILAGTMCSSFPALSAFEMGGQRSRRACTTAICTIVLRTDDAHLLFESTF
jgi:hypothetical protein